MYRLPKHCSPSTRKDSVLYETLKSLSSGLPVKRERKGKVTKTNEGLLRLRLTIIGWGSILLTRLPKSRRFNIDPESEEKK